MAGSSKDWLADRRTEAAADRILDAAERLFTERDPESVGMNEIAAAAGCSRATLYRYFESREALRIAYVHRETHRLGRQVLSGADDDEDPRERLVSSILATLRMVRESPPLAAWFLATRAPIGARMADQSEVITALAASFLHSLGLVSQTDGAPSIVERRARWAVRIIVSLLMFPGRDEADERAMIEEFLAPVMVSAREAIQ
ncbi:TetR family transcriptional regulator [Mycobacterium intermedium]|uniref:TetR family transcriptional regulator n=2 Tax=Mycobacterium TaxID=1763 RepID=A0A1E3S7J6_MYCIE|nr:MULTISPECIES: TetR/AcrR family transcriptional regulator [Mycobacterium]MCV6965312.1 TetR/AcrR family transcriptional regulator [Mycobacterium intermedium]MCV6977258.1 TetR/AcrR family transcriptional regulator [Mycobacterium bourgelatii]ODQ98133.1 TetR family transcriptional regulator [Mycobacterium intermedium]OPE47754.1 TetR family transcriptional regulator [Mycobacterium intermedium]ORA96601.1 TetR family transcriptional regulator [Mycobacterium intermedium]